MQVGNTVAAPVARVLGYSLGLAYQGVAADGPLYTLPEKFLLIRKPASAASSEKVVVSSEEAA